MEGTIEDLLRQLRELLVKGAVVIAQLELHGYPPKGVADVAQCLHALNVLLADESPIYDSEAFQAVLQQSLDDVKRSCGRDDPGAVRDGAPLCGDGYILAPEPVRRLARVAHRQFLQDPWHPSFRRKKPGPLEHLHPPIYEFRITRQYRALAEVDGDTYRWLCLGDHVAFDREVRSLWCLPGDPALPFLTRRTPHKRNALASAYP